MVELVYIIKGTYADIPTQLLEEYAIKEDMHDYFLTLSRESFFKSVRADIAFVSKIRDLSLRFTFNYKKTGTQWQRWDDVCVSFPGNSETHQFGITLGIHVLRGSLFRISSDSSGERVEEPSDVNWEDVSGLKPSCFMDECRVMNAHGIMLRIPFDWPSP